ncbi:MAG TPA: Asp-tRNA(Asn)/Glu-tRNA(Gln) amidotransferase subunit GatB [Candidatus Latescibacteria bacterium]|nr:Asp-tRNA(Asn)/Glu-tRNA(Gln) amidotransferase subunit GatB [Candidatus Latescibacterota bacterium]
MDYETVIGLEVHAQLATRSKIFCGCSTQFGEEPNAQGCPVCLGMPGVLPVLNRMAVEFAIRMALATGCEIASRCRFARKNYFYPDLPKGYQISQYEEPLATGGHIVIEMDGKKKRIGITRIHLEEDAGKLVHSEDSGLTDESLFDVNRCGVPLIEIVSEPDMRSVEEARLYCLKLRQIMRYLGINSGDMEKGAMRFEANVSLRPRGSTRYGTRVEVKNLNSFRAVLRSLEYEVQRQTKILQGGGSIQQETMGWDDVREVTFPQRGKEYAHDYRYFPEPDLVPVDIDRKWIEKVKSELPELPTARKRRFISQYGIPAYDAEVLTTEREIADYYEEALQVGADPKAVSNWVMGDVLRELKARGVSPAEFNISPKHLAELVNLVSDGTISGKIAKTVFEEMVKTGGHPREIVEVKGLIQITDTGAIEQVVEEVLSENPEEVERYRGGKTKLLGFFVGEVMKKTKGKANPRLVNEILRNKLG